MHIKAIKIKRKGITLIETLMAIFIFLLGIAAVVMLFTRAWKTNSFVLEEGNATLAASRALDQTAKELRKVRQGDDGSYGVVSVGPFDLTVFSDIDNDGHAERVHYFLSNGNFRRGITKTQGFLTYPTGDGSVETIAQYVTNTSSQPVFYYYNNDYPIDAENNPLTNPQVGDVRLVSIHLWINIKPKTAPENVNLQTFAELRNFHQND